MSVFFKNTCQFSNCRRNFFTLSDLILHIEGEHLDFDPFRIERLEEEKPESLPLSYVLKYGGPDDAPPVYSTQVSFVNEAVIQQVDDVTEMVTTFNNNYLSDFREVKERKVRLNKDEFSQVLGGNKLFTLDHSHKKPFACNMKGCEKRLIPTLKKSLLKHKSVLTPKSKFEKHDMHGVPLYSYKMGNDVMYQNNQMHRFEDYDIPNEYFYKLNSLPTSDVHFSSNQVPLPNMSFNYYNIAEVGDVEDFSGKNSGFFVPNFEKF
ncbi:uncharacterized protein LOC135140606 isoform X2 [Zophobas morio]|uniref:uncharacterized protein LOC135140606 isoform X2 n=1 Tax=Zophobas morio TaxID=2755281 RepID=UPI0030833E0F